MNLYIRTKKQEGETNLYTAIKIAGRFTWLNLHLPVSIDKFNAATTTLKKENYIGKLGYSKKLHDIDAAIKDLRRRNKLTPTSANDAIQNIVLAEIRAEMELQEQKKKELREKNDKDVRAFVKDFIHRAETGEVKTCKGTPYAPNSIKLMKQVQRIFLNFYRYNHFTWEQIDKRLVDKFLVYLEKEGYGKSVIERYMSFFRTIISIAEIEGLHTNSIAKRLVGKAVPTVREQDMKKQIYLSKEELQALYDMPLEGLKSKVRDVFLVGCYTAQRFSDYSNIDPSCIGKTEAGTRVIRLVQKKTGSKTVIPILDEKLVCLLEKYDYNITDIDDVILNRYIKEICKELSKTVPSLAKIERTLLTKTEREAEKKERMKFERDESGAVIKPRWMLVESHTGRRSAITNMYLSHKYTVQQIMSVSGHKKIETFKKYVRLSLDEMADDVAQASADGLF